MGRDHQGGGREAGGVIRPPREALRTVSDSAKLYNRQFAL